MAAPPLVRAHTIGSPQAKFLKGAEENQLERNILVATIAGAHPSVGGLSVAKTEKIRRKSRSEASKSGWAGKNLVRRQGCDLHMVYV